MEFSNSELFREIKDLDLRISAAHDCCLDSSWHYDRARAAFNRIYFVYGGEGRVVSSGKEYILNPGNIYIFPADTDFAYNCEDTLSKIYFHVNIFRWNRYDLLSGTNAVVFKGCKGQIEEMRRLWQEKDSLAALKIKNIITNLICSAAVRNGITAKSGGKIGPLTRKTLEIIEREMRCTVTASYVSEKLYVSESWLQRVFKEEVGVTFGKYVNDRIMFTAQELLRYSGYSVKEVSERLGFCDQFYFSKVFKNHFGISPQKYRKNVYT